MSVRGEPRRPGYYRRTARARAARYMWCPRRDPSVPATGAGSRRDCHRLSSAVPSPHHAQYALWNLAHRSPAASPHARTHQIPPPRGHSQRRAPRHKTQDTHHTPRCRCRAPGAHSCRGGARRRSHPKHSEAVRSIQTPSEAFRRRPKHSDAVRSIQKPFRSRPKRAGAISCQGCACRRRRRRGAAPRGRRRGWGRRCSGSRR